MSNNTGAVRQGAGYLGGVRSAPLGTTAPTDPTTAYGVGWLDPGIITDDGIVESTDISSTDKRGRDGSITRRIKTDETITLHFVMEETNGVSLDLFYPGSSRATATGVTTHTKKTRTTVKQAFAFDELDQGVHTRTIIPSGEITDFDDVTYSVGDTKMYGITITCYPNSSGVWALTYSDDPNVTSP